MRIAAPASLVLWLVSMAVFALFFVAPSNVARTLGGRQATPETIAADQRAARARPAALEAVPATSSATPLHGDLGYDYYNQVPVTDIITQALPITLSLAVGAAVIWLVLGVFNGVISAVHPRSLADRALTVFALFFYSMPPFLLGLVLLYFLYFKLTAPGYAWFPAGGYVPADATESARGSSTWSCPGSTLALVLRGGLHPAHPRLDARRARRGLHQDRAGQGDLRAPRGGPARAAQRADPGRHPVRHRPRAS